MVEEIKTEEKESMKEVVATATEPAVKEETTGINSKPSVNKFESLENKLRKFKRQSSGIISEVRKREAYDKPSVKRKKKSKEARKNRNKMKSRRSR